MCAILDVYVLLTVVMCHFMMAVTNGLAVDPVTLKRSPPPPQQLPNSVSLPNPSVNNKIIPKPQGNPTTGQDERYLLAKDPACAEDIHRLCDQSLHRNNFAVLECMDSRLMEESELSSDCHHALWIYKRNLTKDDRFSEAAKKMCGTELPKFPECSPSASSPPGYFLSCLMDNQENITHSSCRQFLTKMERIVFSDYRLIYKFTDACSQDIEKFHCGRLDTSDNSPHSQGFTIECLAKSPRELSDDCRHQILRIAEIQSEDFHLDRPLFFACREDRERFCDKVSAGEGKVYRCLVNHKMHKDMSQECREKLTRRQMLVGLDYKVSRGLAKACREDIRNYRCREETSKNREIRLAQILLCLENALHKDQPVAGECQAQMIEHRRSLMEDYHLSPSVVHNCESDIAKFCRDRLEGNGRTIHCLMDHARPTTRKSKRISDGCKRELEILVHKTDIGEDWRVDPVLQEACQSVVDVACQDRAAGEGRVLSCLMDKLGSNQMTEDCAEKLLQIQYFIARDYRLDPKLYKNCNKDAQRLCNAGDRWADDPQKLGPERGPLLPCLFRYADHPVENQKLSAGCIQEVKRVMRQRASNVDLHPEIEAACLNDLAMYCLEKVHKGEEIVCLQDNLEKLSSDCQDTIGNFTEEEAEHIEMNGLLYKVCEPVVQRYCEELLPAEADQGDVIQCLLHHKNDHYMQKNVKCHAAVEHFQLISLKDYRFSFKFKEFCKKDVVDLCKNVRTKGEVVACLSEAVRNDTLDARKQRVSKECRQQLRVELLQRNENFELDPKLVEACNSDREKFCGKVFTGNAQVLECLKDHQKGLSEKCHMKIFNRQQEEMLDSTIDFALTSVCKNMIEMYCNSDPADALNCLKDKKNDWNFDKPCRALVLKRMAQQNIDYRLNPRLRKACSVEVKKFCFAVVDSPLHKVNHDYEGRVIACLKDKFQAHRLRQSCEDEISRIIKDTQLDYRQDPILAEACADEIARLCSESDVLEADGRGQVEECLKVHFQKRDIKNDACSRQVAKIIQEGSADVHVDPILFRACALDIHRFCADIPAGQGKQMKCLLSMAESNSAHNLQDECRSMLNKRMEMYNYAAKVVPPESFQEIVNQVALSSARNYFVVVGLAVIGSIFIGGLFCGRITKRVHYDVKRK